MTNDTTYPVVRRWRGNRATLSVHRDNCPTVKRMEIVYYEHAPSLIRAESQAFRELRKEVDLGTSKWGPICRHCDDVMLPVQPVFGKPVAVSNA